LIVWAVCIQHRGTSAANFHTKLSVVRLQVSFDAINSLLLCGRAFFLQLGRFPLPSDTRIIAGVFDIIVIVVSQMLQYTSSMF
jgi:hypothetical protein